MPKEKHEKLPSWQRVNFLISQPNMLWVLTRTVLRGQWLHKSNFRLALINFEKPLSSKGLLDWFQFSSTVQCSLFITHLIMDLDITWPYCCFQILFHGILQKNYRKMIIFPLAFYIMVLLLHSSFLWTTNLAL